MDWRRPVAQHEFGMAGKQDQARQHHDQRQEQLGIARHHHAHAGMPDVARAQHALDDELVHHPVPHADREKAEKDAGPGRQGMVRRLEYRHAVVRAILGEMRRRWRPAACFQIPLSAIFFWMT